MTTSRTRTAKAARAAFSFLSQDLLGVEQYFPNTTGKYPFTRLLLAVYITSALERSPIDQKNAFLFMGLAEIKTARKYIALAEKLKFIERKRSAQDRRAILCIATPTLRTLIRKRVAFALPLR